MNCPNCGAPLRPVPNREYLVCDYCTSFYFPPQSDEGVRVLGEWSDRSCPRCRQPLVSAVIDLIPVLHCTRCGGNLVTPPNFRRIVESRRAQSAKAPQLRPLAQEQLQRQVNCPNCYRTMDVYPYYGPGNAVIDSCGHCALIWLDHGELKVIITAPNRGRG